MSSWRGGFRGSRRPRLPGHTYIITPWNSRFETREGLRRREYFEDHYPGAIVWLNTSRDLAKQKRPKEAAFLLHQATERLYAGLLLMLTYYTPYIHNIAFLQSLAEGLDRRIYGIWPEATRRERAMFQKLKEAYTKARYSKHYRISEEDLDWLGKRVEELGRTVHTICAERIEQLEQGDGSQGALP